MTVSSPGPYRVHLFAIVLVALTAVASSGHRVRALVRSDAPKFVFAVHIPGVESGFFRQVSGLGVATDVIEYQEGGSSHVRKLPGRTRWKTVVLERGFTGTPSSTTGRSRARRPAMRSSGRSGSACSTRPATGWRPGRWRTPGR